MKQKKFLLFSTLAALATIVTAGTALVARNVTTASASVGSYSTSASTYYSSITATSGSSLLGQLHDLLCNTHKTYTTYNDCKTANYVYATDPGTSSSYVRDFYTHNNIAKAWGSGATGTWNREHVWCQSLSSSLWGTTGGGSDLHHVRPIESTLNSTRNNHPFGVVSSHTSSTVCYAKNTSGSYITSYPGGYYYNDVFEPIDAAKGDVARILMYDYVHYTSYKNLSGATTNGSGSSSYFGSLDITKVVHTSSGTASAAWSLLLSWHNADPVDSSEKTRNEAAAKYQGNRNPFIDNSSYANAIWGSGTASSGSSSGSSSSGSSSSGSTTTTTTKTITIKYSDSFSPALPTSSSAAKTSAYGHTDSTAGITFKEAGIYKASSASYIMFKKNAGYLYNTSSLTKVTKVAITYSSGTGTSGKIGVYFGSSAKTSYTTSSNKTIAGKSATDTFTNSSSYGYFQISTSNANVQITQIVITYVK